MQPADVSAARERLTREVRDVSGLDLLLLYGSRARGDAHPMSDWDVGYLGSPSLDAAGLVASLVTVLGTDRVDVVDLARAGGLLRFRAARDGALVFERAPGLADAFRLEAARFWCDVEPVLRHGYERVLARLGR
jgi:predicted nucleotidyltransferase